MAVAPPASAAVTVIVLEGEGWGHGVGMAQDGAFWMGEDGASTSEILAHFYPGTSAGQAGGDVRVTVATPGAEGTVVVFPSGGEIRSPLHGDQAPGFPIGVAPGGAVRLRHDGTYRAEPLGGASTRASSGRAARIDLGSGGRPLQVPLPTSSTTSTTTGSTTTTTSLLPGTSSTTAPSSTTTTAPRDPLPIAPTTTPPPPPEPGPGPEDPAPPPEPGAPTSSSPLWAVPGSDGTTEVTERARRYRGVIEATAAGGPFRLLNHVDVEQYLRGMGEVRDARWSAASLGAQAVAARTYALRSVVAGAELCDTQKCQVYLGQQAEYGKMDEAVRTTRGKVLTFGRGLAVTVYSANGGGISATPEEGFGTASMNFPYLRAAPYTTRSPDPWRVDIGAADLGARL
ncbi:MAG: SpoIID/LytB domain-containing protein, partial [Acidimicrobiales bacterium]